MKTLALALLLLSLSHPAVAAQPQRSPEFPDAAALAPARGDDDKDDDKDDDEEDEEELRVAVA